MIKRKIITAIKKRKELEKRLKMLERKIANLEKEFKKIKMEVNKCFKARKMSLRKS